MSKSTLLSSAPLLATLLLLSACGQDKATAPKPRAVSQDRLAPPEEPVTDCSTQVGGCPPAYSDEPGNGPYFDTTEGKNSFVSQQNPTGAIVNVAVISDLKKVPAGYKVLLEDLNAGISGTFSNPTLYAIYTRDPQAVRNYFTEPLDPAPRVITGLIAGEQFNYNSSGADFWCSLNTSSIPGPKPHNYVRDLNEGAGGATINASSVYGGSQEIEIGILDGLSNPNAQPPTGYIRVNYNMNEGAGGHYVYLCYKYR